MATRSEELRLRALRLSNDGKPEDALAIVEQALSAEDATLADLATALKDKAVILGFLGQWDEALSLFDQVIRCHQHSINATEKLAVDKSLYNKAVLLNRLGRADEAIACYDRVAIRNAHSLDLEPQRVTAQSLFNKGNILGESEDGTKNAIACYQLVARQFEASEDVALKEIVSKCLVSEAYAHVAVDRGVHWITSSTHKDLVFNLLDRAIAVLARSPYDNDSLLLQAARAIAMKAHFMGVVFGSDQKEDCKRFETVARQFGAARATKILGFAEIENNLHMLSAFANRCASN